MCSEAPSEVLWHRNLQSYRGGDVPASHQRRELNKKGSACAAQDSTALRMEDVTGRKTNIPKAASQTE